MYLELSANGVAEKVQKFIKECRNEESRAHLVETVAYLEMGRQKMQGILEIDQFCLFAAHA